MRVVDPKVAYSMLHRETPATQQPFHQQFQPPVSSANGCKFLLIELHICDIAILKLLYNSKNKRF